MAVSRTHSSWVQNREFLGLDHWFPLTCPVLVLILPTAHTVPSAPPLPPQPSGLPPWEKGASFLYSSICPGLTGPGLGHIPPLKSTLWPGRENSPFDQHRGTCPLPEQECEVTRNESGEGWAPEENQGAVTRGWELGGSEPPMTSSRLTCADKGRSWSHRGLGR